VTEQRSIQIPAEHFTLFDGKRDGKVEIIVVNDALLAFPHIDLFPWHLSITLEARDLVDNGMPSPEESELLFAIGDEIERTVAEGRTGHGAQNAIFLARSTWDGWRELVFVVHDPEVAHASLQKLLESRDWDRPWEYRMAADSEWEKAAFIFQLFPQAKGADA
jgi:hypothetical protein